MKLPTYKCHKEVQALKIKDIMTQGGISSQEAKSLLKFSDPGYEAFDVFVDTDYLKRHRPQVGGYYVVYADGYKSFSPAKAFEEGYTRI